MDANAQQARICHGHSPCSVETVELHRHREARKKKKMVATASATASASASTSASTSGRTRDLPDASDQLMDLDALTSANEFRLAVNEWFGDLDAEDRLAGLEHFPSLPRQLKCGQDNSEQPLDQHSCQF
ncbi:TPA: hypothetical protein ACH3X1_002464 [Trebouxia sp. C0004]